jgi:hypothetical protein
MEEENGKTAGQLARAQHPRRIVAHATEEPGESKSPVLDWAIGCRLMSGPLCSIGSPSQNQ